MPDIAHLLRAYDDHLRTEWRFGQRPVQTGAATVAVSHLEPGGRSR